jgi:hypothetical protein
MSNKEKSPTSNQDGVSKRCDSCEKDFEQDDMRMLDDDWWLCEDCFIEGSEGCCEYSSYCNYTGYCDYAC